MEREEIGLLAACYLLQYLAEGSELSEHFPFGWNTVGKVAEELHFPRVAAERIFAKWQERGWLDERSVVPYRCQLTQSGHVAAQTHLMYKDLKTA